MRIRSNYQPTECKQVDGGIPPNLRRFCLRCGFFKVHGRTCMNCATDGTYKQMAVESETMKAVVQMIHLKPKGSEVRDYLEQHLLYINPVRAIGANKKDPRSRAQLSIAGVRILSTKQLRLVTLLLQEVCKLFEVDERGDIQLYEDRMPEVREVIGVCKKLLPDLLWRFKMPGAPTSRPKSIKMMRRGSHVRKRKQKFKSAF